MASRSRSRRFADAMRRLNRGVINPLARTFAGRRFSPYVLVRHRGRRSGHVYATPLLAFRGRGEWLVPLTFGPRSDWVQNLLASETGEFVAWGHPYQILQPRVLARHEALARLRPPLRWLAALTPMRTYLLVPYAASDQG